MLNPNKLNIELFTKLYVDITEFRNTFDLPVNTGIDVKADQLHTSLIVEEMTELAQADSKIEQADAIVDSVYVLMGRVVHVGTVSDGVQSSQTIAACTHIDILLTVAENMGIDFLACWDDIHASNMSKVCNNEEEFEETKAFYAKSGIEVVGVPKNGKIVVKCSKDHITPEKTVREGKVLKSVHYRPANLEPLL